jgi:putative restriction endonuclease
MKFWVGVTDNQWFKFLSEKKPDEVNFWQPSATAPFTTAPTGMPFLFKLKRPYNHIAGGGYFVTYSRLPLSLAWEVFGEKNGCSSLDELRRIITPLVSHEFRDGDIGCTVLANPFFLEQKNWVADPLGWSSNIVRGKMYDTTAVLGRELWECVQLSLSAQPVKFAAEPREKYGDAIPVRPRLGQSSFRVLVTDAYQRRCAITGESTLVALEAAHIVPYSDAGDHDVRNGLLLRADFHRLFDVGLVGVTPDLKIKVSPRIREKWFNGKVYYQLNDKPLSVIPMHQSMRPDPDRLEWHFQNRFQAS